MITQRARVWPAFQKTCASLAAAGAPRKLDFVGFWNWQWEPSVLTSTTLSERVDLRLLGTKVPAKIRIVTLMRPIHGNL